MEIEIGEEPTPPSITSYRNAILAMEDVNELLSSKGHIEVHSVCSAIDMIAGLQAS